MLIIQIALGIVLGFLILAFLPQLLRVGVVVIGLVLAAILLLALWVLLEPYRDEILLVAGTLMMAAVAYGLVLQLRDIYSPGRRSDPPMDAQSVKEDSKPQLPGSIFTAAFSAIISCFLTLVVVAAVDSFGILHSWPVFLRLGVSGLIWAGLVVALFFFFKDFYVRREEYRQWRVVRREELGNINMENHVPSPGLDEYLARRDKSTVDAG